jgi:hypothetical protein
MDKSDNDLKRLFCELAEQDVQRLPAFEAVICRRTLTRKNSRQGFQLRWAWGLALTIVAVSLGSFTVWRFNEGNRKAETTRWAALSDWVAASDHLLEISNASMPDNTIFSTDFLLSIQCESTENTLPDL